MAEGRTKHHPSPTTKLPVTGRRDEENPPAKRLEKGRVAREVENKGK